MHRLPPLPVIATLAVAAACALVAALAVGSVSVTPATLVSALTGDTRDVAATDERDLRLPRDTVVPTLTLVTCYPFDALDPGGPLRYVVVAEAT